MSPRFENLVACHLAKWVEFEQDVKGRDVELRYFRDVDGREVDFVVCERAQPKLLVECKWGDDGIVRGLSYLKERFAAAEKTQKTPAAEIKLARRRQKEVTSS